MSPAFFPFHPAVKPPRATSGAFPSSHNTRSPLRAIFQQLGSRAVLPLLLCGALQTAVAEEEDAVKGWSFLALDAAPTTQQFLDEGIALAVQGVGNSRIVDGTTPATNPFSHTTRAFFVNQFTEAETPRIAFRPFPGTVVTEGSLSFDFMIMEGDITAVVGITNQPWSAESSNLPTQRFFPLRLAPRQSIRINNESGYYTTESRELGANQNYQFRIDWSVTDSFAEFRFFLSGSPVLDQDGNPVVTRVQRMDFESGELVFGITSKFTGFLGSIRATAASP